MYRTSAVLPVALRNATILDLTAQCTCCRLLDFSCHIAGLSNILTHFYSLTFSFFFFFLMIRHPPKSPLFPSTPLFRSALPPLRSRLDLDGSHQRRRHVDHQPQHRAGQGLALCVMFQRNRPSPAERVMQHEIQRSEEHTSELQSLTNLVCRLLLEKKKTK